MVLVNNLSYVRSYIVFIIIHYFTQIQPHFKLYLKFGVILILSGKKCCLLLFSFFNKTVGPATEI